MITSGLMGALALFSIKGLSDYTPLPPVTVIDTPSEPILEQSPPVMTLRPVNLPMATPPDSHCCEETSKPHLHPPEPPAVSISSHLLAAQASETLYLIEELALEEEQRQREAQAEEERLAKLAEEKRKRDAEAQKLKKAREAEARARQKRELAHQHAEEHKRQAAERARQKEASRKAALAKKIASAPIPTRKSQPRYPSSARRARIEGTVRIITIISSSGRVQSPRVVSSSGNSSLDQAALNAVKKWRFQPAKNALGEAVAYQYTIPITFRLD